jgi:hypothetical protein
MDRPLIISFQEKEYSKSETASIIKLYISVKSKSGKMGFLKGLFQ